MLKITRIGMSIFCLKYGNNSFDLIELHISYVNIAHYSCSRDIQESLIQFSIKNNNVITPKLQI